MNNKRLQKERLYQLFSQIATAMANPHRLELLDLLVQAPRTVEDLAQEAHMSIANTSQHLQKLKQAKLVADERTGIYIWYRLADPAVAHLWLELRQVAEKQLTELEQALDDYRHQRHQFTPISPAELHQRLSQHEVVLLDVRPAVEYQAGHLPQAISIPIAELEERLHELPPDKTVVAYCRGPYCVYADEALELLHHHGRPVNRLDVGVAEWQAAGFELEKIPHA